MRCRQAIHLSFGLLRYAVRNKGAELCGKQYCLGLLYRRSAIRALKTPHADIPVANGPSNSSDKEGASH